MTTGAASRILIVTRNLPPLVGGMERLNWHMAEELSRVAAVRIVAPQACAALAPTGVAVCGVPLRPLWKFLLQARKLARREARTWRPDVVLAGSGLTAPIARSAARTCDAATAVYVHGLDLAVRHPVYRAVWLPAIRRMDRVIANSHATAALCRAIGSDPARIVIVHPGVDLPPSAPVGGPEGPTHLAHTLTPSPAPVGGPEGPTHPSHTLAASAAPVAGPEGPTHPGHAVAASAAPTRAPADAPASDARHFRQRHQLGAAPLLLSVGRLSARKGLREFVTQALPRITAEHPDAILLIVGDAPKDALHAQAQTPQAIRAAAQQAGVADNVRFLGTITDFELGVAYRAADVHVFPVRDIPGDPEGFGMVAVEAAAHGLPTVAFAIGGVIDAVAEGESGHLVAAGNYPAFADAVLQTLATGPALRAHCTAFAARFAWPEFGHQIIAALNV